MDGITHYSNTDLVLRSAHDLTPLAAALDARETRLWLDHGHWYARFSGASMADQYHHEPEPTIAAMLAVIEALDAPLRSAWAGCSHREFDIGYECGRDPVYFHQGLSARILGRLVAAGASLRVTLYANRDVGPAETAAAPDRPCG